MATTFSKQYAITATSEKYGDALVAVTLSFDNASNTSTLTIGEGFIIGGQTTGCTSTGAPLAGNASAGNVIKLYSLKALTKLGTNHIYIFKSDEVVFNKKTRYVCDLTAMALTIKGDIYNWRKGNE